MSDLEIVENITKVKCAVCGDKLTAWENNICILCEDQTMYREPILNPAETWLLFIALGTFIYAIFSKK